MANVLGFVVLGLSGLALVFALIALALPSWEDSTYLRIGLFRYCAKNGGDCENTSKGVVDSKKDALRATQAMVILGFVALVVTLVLVILAVFVKKGNKMLGYLAGIFAIVGGALLMIGVGIYADKVSHTGFDYGASFALCILGWLFGWATGGLMLFITIRGGGAAAS